jgi:hypothetical protein
MKGGDHGYPFSLFFEDHLGHIGGRRVGDGIMYMQEIDIVVDDHIHHGAAEGGLIRRIIEQGVSGYTNLVVKYIGVEFA